MECIANRFGLKKINLSGVAEYYKNDACNFEESLVSVIARLVSAP